MSHTNSLSHNFNVFNIFALPLVCLFVAILFFIQNKIFYREIYKSEKARKNDFLNSKDLSSH